MITINLLPQEIQEARKRKVRNLKLNLIGLFFGGVFVLIFVAIHFGLFAFQFHLSSKLSHLEEKYEELRPEAEAIMAYKDSIDQLTRKKLVVMDLMSSRILWAAKLNQLSDLLPSRVWLSNYEVKIESESVIKEVKMPDGTTMEKPEKVEYLVMRYEGGVISFERKEMLDLIGELISSVKKNKDYFDIFRDIELLRTERQKDKLTGYEYMTFILQSRFQDGYM